MKTIAVIQPYFYPYAGYFRLFAAADAVVMFDCVQFPRRGWVHRNRFPLANGELDWLTLPLAKAPRETRIAHLRFRPGAVHDFEAQVARFPLLEKARARAEEPMNEMLSLHGMDAAAYLCDTVEKTSIRLGIDRPVVRSSTLGIDEALHGQDRVLEIVRRLGGNRYVNPSGGRELYDHETFNNAGIELRFLAPYEGPMESILARILSEPIAGLRDELLNQTRLCA